MKRLLAAGLIALALSTPALATYVRLTGSGNTTGTAPTTVIAAQGVGVKIYVTSVQCHSTGSTTTIVTLNDSASSTLIVPLGSGDNQTYSQPLVVPANTDLTFTPSAAETTIYCNAQGYSGA